MLCPLCKKEMTSVIKDIFIKKTNTIRRDRYCKCGFLFSTFEKFKKDRSNRKVRPDTYWKKERMYLYGLYRYQAAAEAFEKLLTTNKFPIFKIKGRKGIDHISGSKQIRSIEDLENVISKRKKIEYKSRFFYQEDKGKARFGVEINGKKYFQPLASKKDTITRIVKEKDYWEMREIIMNKDISDSINKDKIRKEINEYYKSVCSYIKMKDFDQSFFIKESRTRDSKNFWKNSQVWLIYTSVR